MDITEPGKNLGDANWKDRKTLEPLLPENEGDDLLRFQTGIDTSPGCPATHLPDSVKANPSAEDMAYYVVLPDGIVRDRRPGAGRRLHAATC